MVRLSWFEVTKVSGNACIAALEYHKSVEVKVWLRVLDRPGQSDLHTGSRVFAVWDDVQGEGVCLYSPDGFNFSFSGDISVSGGITTSDSIKSTGGDVAASNLGASLNSMATHIHIAPPTGGPTEGPIQPEGGVDG